MNQQKGFSLVEVLASLMLITTLVFSLVQYQSQSKGMLNQLRLRIQATHYLDQVEETQIAQIKKLPQTPSLFHLLIQQKARELSIKLAWNQQLNSMTRQHRYLGLFSG